MDEFAGVKATNKRHKSAFGRLTHPDYASLVDPLLSQEGGRA
jgi:hypothetical protein